MNIENRIKLLYKYTVLELMRVVSRQTVIFSCPINIYVFSDKVIAENWF